MTGLLILTACGDSYPTSSPLAVTQAVISSSTTAIIATTTTAVTTNTATFASTSPTAVAIAPTSGLTTAAASSQPATISVGSQTSPAQLTATATIIANTTAVPNVLDTVDPAARCYINAVNDKGLEGLVGCFAPDGTVMDVSRPIKGQAAIRTWARNEVIGGTLQVLENQATPGRNRLLVHWAPAGSNGWQAWYTFEFADGKIILADLQYA